MRRMFDVGLSASLALILFGGACTTPDVSSQGEKAGSSSSLVGKPAPDFTLPSTTGEEVSLSDYRGKKAVLLYFSMGPG